VSTFHCEYAWLGGDHVDADVTIAVDDGVITEVVTDERPPPRGATRLAGVTIPGFVDAHSHAFHRVLRGRAQRAGDFWAWRDEMYRVAAALDPDSYRVLAECVFAESALAGITSVYEFHYLHHRSGGARYDDPNAMGYALAAAASAAGVRLTLLDTCYLRAGFDEQPLDPVQRRFCDGNADEWAARVSTFSPDAGVTVGAAVHSVRAVDAASMATVAAWAAAAGAPLHVHVSEQPAENDACVAATGRSPTALCADAGVLGPRTIAVHATHVTDDDISLIATTATTVCLCPTTERDLGDGIGPAAAFASAGSPIVLGTDSHAVVDPFEEARAVDLDERLRSGRRGARAPAALLGAATASSGLRAGMPADFVAVDLGSVRLAGFDPADGAAHLVFAASAADVRDVFVGAEPVVAGGLYVRMPDVAGRLRAAIFRAASHT
jgi:formiminoglutamate deiminase